MTTTAIMIHLSTGGRSCRRLALATLVACSVLPSVLCAAVTLAGTANDAASEAMIDDERPLSASLGRDESPVTLEQAVVTAVAAIPGRAVEAQLSADEGRVVYEVEIIGPDLDRRRVYVDAEVGKVIKVRSDTPFRR
jgi:uncharacterized membrane protein YkoI